MADFFFFFSICYDTNIFTARHRCLEQTRRTLRFHQFKYTFLCSPYRKPRKSKSGGVCHLYSQEQKAFDSMVSSLSSLFQHDGSHPVSSAIIVPLFNVRAMAAARYGVFILDSEVMGSANLDDRE